ncbi:hypothetical protein V1478_001849 [Vespula squamosa]|uniref:Uncharacterized protein n=1 Tax=Vespula squamosa TaxID=30214 RepID=A0ABD2BZW2_VESSQ
MPTESNGVAMAMGRPTLKWDAGDVGRVLPGGSRRRKKKRERRRRKEEIRLNIMIYSRARQSFRASIEYKVLTLELSAGLCSIIKLIDYERDDYDDDDDDDDVDDDDNDDDVGEDYGYGNTLTLLILQSI